MKVGVLRNFSKFTGKQLCRSLRPATLCEAFKNIFLKEYVQETGSKKCFENVWSCGSEVLYKKRLENLTKFIEKRLPYVGMSASKHATSFKRNSGTCVFLCILQIF